MEFRPTELPPDEINVTPVHPLREAATLIVGLAALLLVVAALFAWSVDLAVGMISPEAEARLFSSLHLDDALDSGDERRAEVQEVLTKLAQRWPDAAYEEFRVAILELDDPNAAALPGGVVLVTTGLLDQVESENELAFVLGHELGHFRNRDHLRRLGRGVVYGLALTAVVGSSGFAMPDLATASVDLAGRGFDREQEREADRFGLELVQETYGHVDSSWHFFERLASETPELERVIAYLSTHPASGERVVEIRRYAEEQEWPLEGAVEPFPREPADEE